MTSRCLVMKVFRDSSLTMTDITHLAKSAAPGQTVSVAFIKWNLLRPQIDFGNPCTGQKLKVQTPNTTDGSVDSGMFLGTCYLLLDFTFLT